MAPTSELLSAAEVRDGLNPGLRAYKTRQLEAALERQRNEAAWQAAWKAGAPERRKIARTAHYAKRRAALLLRVPAWADRVAIRAVYAQARRLTVETGTLHHVDHIYPLQGRHISGLHVEANLAVLPASENIRKGNRYEP